MPNLALKLSEHPLSQAWLAQFNSVSDKTLAATLLDKLILVSQSEFEDALRQSVDALQQKLGEDIAVLPVCDPVGLQRQTSSPFSGGQDYGSEDRVKHVLKHIERGNHCVKTDVNLVTGNGSSSKPYAPIIKHIVLVDDVCGSGDRLVEYWKDVVPKRVKRLLSAKTQCLWVICYAATKQGVQRVFKAMPNFPQTNFIHTIKIGAYPTVFSREELDLCKRYAKSHLPSEYYPLGYNDQPVPLIFAHGCPDNVPTILYASEPRKWKALFENRAIPPEMSSLFGLFNSVRGVERLNQANQSSLALALVDSLKSYKRLPAELYQTLIFLGLKLRGMDSDNISRQLLIPIGTLDQISSRCHDAELLDSEGVTEIGRELVQRFRNRTRGRGTKVAQRVDRSPMAYYPHQCGGYFKLGNLGGTTPPNSGVSTESDAHLSS